MDETPIQSQTNSFKLIKNSRGYGWEIKIYDEDIKKIQDLIDEMNRWAKIKYGDEDGN